MKEGRVLGAEQRTEPTELEPAVIRAAKAGDRHARRLLVVMYQDRVVRLIRRILAPGGRRDALVEDVAQDTFLRAFAALPRFEERGPARLSTWLLTIATRRAIDAVRDASRRPTVALPADEIVDDHSTFGRTDDRLLGRALARAMADLPAEQRAVFVLREYHGMDYAEIGMALDLPAGTIASRLSRARQALQRALEGAGS